MVSDSKRKGSAGETITAYRFLTNGANVYIPVQTGKRDLGVELWQGKFFGVQVKGSGKPIKETSRKQKRYRFSFKKSAAEVYDKNIVQIFALCALDKALICFIRNDGDKVHFNISDDSFTKQLENESYATLLKGLNNDD